MGSSSFPRGENLWTKAFESIQDEVLKQKFRVDVKTHRRDILAAALQAIDTRKEQCILKRFKYKSIDGRTIIIRDVLEKLATWIRRFKGMRDAKVPVVQMAQGDAVYASLPWAAVRFLMKVTIEDHELFGAIAIEVEEIVRLITEFDALEQQHLDQISFDQREDLETSLVHLYAEMLEQLARMVNFPKEDFIADVGEHPFRLGDISELMERIHEKADEVLNIARLTDEDRGRFHQTTVTRLSDQTTDVLQPLTEEKRQRVYQWLSAPPYQQYHQFISESRVSRSGEWLFNEPQFQKWNSSSYSSILHLRGIIGSGKTHICSTVIDSILNHATDHHSMAPFAYFYCANIESEKHRSSSDQIMRAILRQLAIDRADSAKVREILWSEYDRRAAAARVNGLDIVKLKTKDCVTLILELAEEDPITIIIDAIDLIDKNDRSKFIEALKQIISQAGNVIKVFVTSRDDVQLYSKLAPDQQITITSANTYIDRKLFVTHQIDNALKSGWLDGRLSTEARRQVQESLIRSDEGLLWAKLQLQLLYHETSENSMSCALQANLHASVEDLYRSVLHRILQTAELGRDIVICVFSLLLYAQDPLSPQAFLQAISKAASRTFSLGQLLDMFHHLIVFDPECNVLRFAHQSLQQFLSNQPQFSFDSGHAFLATLCLKICSDGQPYVEDAVTPTDDFLVYAAMYWPVHLSMAQKNIDVLKQAFSFMFTENLGRTLSYDLWMKHNRQLIQNLLSDHSLKPRLDSIPDTGAGPFFLASVFGLHELLRSLLDAYDFVDLSQQNHLGQHPVYLAAALGHFDTLSILLEHNAASINIEGGKYGSALHAACFLGHVKIVDKLLEMGALLKVGGVFVNALDAAFRGGQEDVALRLLEEGNALFSTEDEYNETLFSAMQAGFLQVLRKLEEPPFGALFGAEEIADRTKMMAKKAIESGKIEILRWLLKSANPTDILPDDAIAIAALHGSRELIEPLLANGASLEARGVLGSPLRTAVLLNHRAIVQVLLDHGANLNLCKTSSDAFLAAALKGLVGILKLLIRAGAEINRNSEIWGSPLQAAAFHGHMDAVKILLDAGADIHAGGYAKDAFHAAAEGGHRAIVSLMLERGYQFSVYQSLTCGGCGWTPPPIYRRLLRSSSPTRSGRAPVISGVSAGRYEHGLNSKFNFRLDTYLLDPTPSSIGSDTDPVSKFAQQFAATYSKKPDKSRRRINLPQNYPLEASASCGQKEVVQFLLKNQRLLGWRDDQIHSALVLAAAAGHVDVIEVLLAELPSNLLNPRKLQSVIESAWQNDQVKALEFVRGYVLNHFSSEFIEELHERVDLIIESPSKMQGIEGDAETNRQVQTRYFLRCCEDGSIDVLTKPFEPLNFDIFKLEDMTKGIELCITRDRERLLQYLLSSQPTLVITEETFVKAIVKGSLGIIKLLISHGKLLISKTAIDHAIIYTCEIGNFEVLDYLVCELEIDVNKPCIDQPTKLRWMGHMGWTRFTAESSSRYSLSPPSPRYSPAYSTFDAQSSQASSDDEEVPEKDVIPNIDGIRSMKDLFHKETPRNKLDLSYITETTKPDKITPLQAAIRPCLYEVDDHEDIRMSFNSTKSTHAYSEQFQKTVQMLLDYGANPNELSGQNFYPIQAVSKHCPPVIVKHLIDAGADVNLKKKGNSSLLEAIERELNPASILRQLIDAGADLPTEEANISKLFEGALKFFDDTNVNDRKGHPEGLFKQISDLKDVLENGPGGALRVLLQQYPHAKARDRRYGLLLQMASRMNDLEFFELLIARDVNVNWTGSYYGTALQAASRCGNLRVVDRLLGSGADPDICEGRWYTALRAAIAGGHEEVFRRLIDQGADMQLEPTRLPQTKKNDRSKDDYETTPQLAVKSSCAWIVKSLLTAGISLTVDTSSESKQPDLLSLSAKLGNFDIVNMLIEAGLPVNGLWDGSSLFVDEKSVTPLHEATEAGHSDIAQLLLNSGAEKEISIRGTGTPLVNAAKTGRRNAVQLLIQHGADVNHCGRSIDTALACAAQKGHEGIVRDLLAAGARAVEPEQRMHALRNSLWARNYAIAEMLLEAIYETGTPEAAVDDALKWSRNGDGVGLCLLLDYATLSIDNLIRVCSNKVIRAVKYMVDQGVDVNGLAGDGNYPLREAAFSLHPPTVQVLVENGANVNYYNDRSGTSLVSVMAACAAPQMLTWLNHDESSRLVHQLQLPSRMAPFVGAVLFQGDIVKETACRRAENCEMIINTLLDNGASVHGAARPDGPPLHLACLLGMRASVERIIGQGADVNELGGFFEHALLAALKGNRSEIVALLLENGAHTTHVHKEYGTPLHQACLSSDTTCLKMLLNHGANTNATDANGKSPLSYALTKYKEPVSYKQKRDPLRYEKSHFSILLQAATDVRVTEDDLNIACTLERSLNVIMALRRLAPQLFISEQTICTFLAKGYPEEDSFRQLMEWGRYDGVTAEMLKSPCNETAMAFLLKYPLACRVTPEILMAHQNNDLIGLLLDADPNVCPTEEVILNILRFRQDKNVLPRAWEKNMELKVSQDMLKAAAGPEKLEFLLDHLQQDPTDWAEAVLLHINSASYLPDRLARTRLMLQRCPNFRPSSTLAWKIIDKVPDIETLEMLLNHDPSMTITPKMFLRIFNGASRFNGDHKLEMIKILYKHHKKLVFTKEMRALIDGNYHTHSTASTKEDFYSLRERDATQEEEDELEADGSL